MGESDAELVVVSYEKLHSGADLSKQIADAYSQGWGVIAISDVPGFVEARDSLLICAHDLAHLPQETLRSLEDENSLYNAGWSHGKEKLGDKPDFAKGSFYFNPLSDLPGTAEDRAKYPLSYPINIWPEKDIPQLKPAAKKLGKIMHECCIDLAGHIDKYAASKISSYDPKLMEDAMRKTDKAKGRLLYYFPFVGTEGKNTSESWIGWHNDSGFLTALAGDIYVDDETGKIIECPDTEAGLYVVNRNGQEVKVDIPKNCMAIQLGECTQIITGGALTATPHYVRGAKAQNVARISCPCFIDTAPTFKLSMPPGSNVDSIYQSSDKVPPLRERWTEDGMTFGDFLGKTFEKYYEHTKK